MFCKSGLLIAFAAFGGATAASACQTEVSVCANAETSSLSLIVDGRPATIVVDATADSAVTDAADAFSHDLAKVAGSMPSPAMNAPAGTADVVLIGVLGSSPLIDRLVAQRNLPVSDIRGKWEAYRQIVVDDPFRGIRRALVIAGADRRGAVFGTYDLSKKIGVSPWAWWADVPVRRQSDLYVTAGSHADAPKVRYRGIFINDEDLPSGHGRAESSAASIRKPMPTSST